jgi:RHS repeat-associated protein
MGTNANTIKNHNDDLSNLEMTKNGYLYIYVSNESLVAVFFDNLQVAHTRSPILEETHYYPFGLTMAGISSKAATTIENKYKFNGGSELNSSFDINLYETMFRSLDPQLGRFWQVDPLAETTEFVSLFAFGNDNPVRLNDPLGLSPTDWYGLINSNGTISMYQNKGKHTGIDYHADADQTFYNMGEMS